MLSLDLAIATHRPEGIRRLAKMLLPPAGGIRYIVSWQNHLDAELPPEIAARKDVEVYRFDKTGQSLNRNNAIGHCRADIILHSDDDLVLYPEGLEQLRRAFEDNPEVDLATFKSVHGPDSRFPKESSVLNEGFPKGYYAACFEIAFRKSTAGFLRCCPELGLGTPLYHGGEDEMFVQSALHRGLNCRYFPITICAHPHESTGTKQKLTPYNLRASGVVIALTYPCTAALRIPLKAWRVFRQGQAPLAVALWNILRGGISAPALRRRNRATLW